jgi:hypothetical protein
MGVALQVDFLQSGMIDSSGNPLASGKVYTYQAGTNTPKATYTDTSLVSPATNPVILNAYGQANIYAYGNYKFIIKNSADATIATYDNIQYFVQDDLQIYGGTSSGSGGAYAITVSTSLTAYSAGLRFTFIPNHTVSAGASLNVNALGVKTIRTPLGNTLRTGQIYTGRITEVLYDGTDFILISPHNGELTSYTPTFGTSGAMTFTSTNIIYARYQVHDGFYTFDISFNGTTGGVASTTITCTIPFAPVDFTAGGFHCMIGDGGYVNGVAETSGTTLSCKRVDGANFGLGAGRGATVSGRVFL